MLVGAGDWRVAYSIVVALLLWHLLEGARVAWWVELAGIGIALASLLGSWQRVARADELAAFVSPAKIALAAALLGVALALLLTPVVRRYCDVAPRAPMRAVGLAFAAVFVGSCQAAALTVDPLLPSRSNSERTPNLVHVGTDHGAPSLFYVGGRADQRCIAVLEPRHSSTACHGRRGYLEHLHATRTENVLAWAMPLNAVRVDVVYAGGVRREAESLYRPGAASRVFYTTIELDDVRGIEAYDAAGDPIVPCPSCDLTIEVHS